MTDTVTDFKAAPAAEPPARAPILALDDLTIGRIAAGEVIERPSSVVKELIENSLDAGATDLRVEFAAGGRRLIRVQDNGSGIPADEVLLAFQRHATSKLRRSADLDAIATLGFRGEALASIASVSHVTLTTCAVGERTGTLLRIDNGNLLAQQPTGAPAGTVFTVENIFTAVPARLKFLKTDATEASRIIEVVSQYALAHPERRFTLVKDGRTVLRSPGTGDVGSALEAVFGAAVARQLIPVGAAAEVRRPDRGVVEPLSGSGLPPGDRHAEAGPTPDQAAGSSEWPSTDVKVTGFVSPPHLHRANRRDLTLFVNGRLIQDTTLNVAITQAYHTLLPQGRFPIAVLMIELPPLAVDVNVHPAKTEVRFRDARRVFGAVERAVRATVLGQAGVAPFHPTGSLASVPTPTPRAAFRSSAGELPGTGAGRPSGWTRPPGAGSANWTSEPAAWRSGSDEAWQTGPPAREGNIAANAAAGSAAAATFAPPTDGRPMAAEEPGTYRLPADAVPVGVSRTEEAPPDDVGAGASGLSASPPRESRLPREPRLPPLRLLGQVGLAYLVAEGPDGLYLIDQHAAHERVMYEDLMLRRAAAHRQHLLAPEPVPLSARQRAAAHEYGELLAAAGYELEPFGDDAVLLRSVPEVLSKVDPSAALGSVLDGLGEDRAPVDEALEARLVRVVCKQATVKAGQALSPAEMRTLVERLEACASPRTCPHGRPTVVELSAAQLAAAFGR